MKINFAFWRIFCVFAVSILFNVGIAVAEVNMAKQVKLPEPKTDSKTSLEQAIQKRRSIRSYEKKDLTLEQVSQLLWAAQGITDSATGFRAAPSAGAIFPIEIYVVKSEGLFHYVPQGHKLEVLSDKDLRKQLSAAARGQGFVADVGVDIIIACDFNKISSRYGQRGSMYAYVEAGHIAQNIHLEAVSLGLGSVPVGAFSDADVKAVLSLPKNQEPIYIIPVGYPK